MKSEVEEWCGRVAVFGVDMLVDYGLISKDDFEKATAIVAEEIHVRLCLNDYPPQFPSRKTNPKE